MFRLINIRRAWRSIAEVADRGRRLERVKEVQGVVEALRSSIQAEVTRLDAALTALDSHPGRDPRSDVQRRGALMLAVLLVVADAPLQYLLTVIAFPLLTWWISIVVALSVALGLTAFVHGAAVSFLHDQYRPARALRLCRMLAYASFVCVVAGASVLLYSRVATPDTAGRLVDVTSVCIWITAETLPLASGLFWVLARFLGEPASVERHLGEARRAQDALARFAQKLDDEEQRLVHKESPIHRIGTAAVLLVLGILVSAADGHADIVARAPSVQRVMFGAMNRPLWVMQGKVGGRVCAVARDRTASVDGQQLRAGLDLFVGHLPEFAAAFGCGALILVSFADEGRFAPRRLFELPSPVAAPDCAHAPPVTLRGTASVLVAVSGFRAYAQSQGEHRCQEQWARDSARFAVGWKAALAEIREGAGQEPAPPDVRTDIVGMLRSLEEAGVEVAVVISDGVDNVNTALPTFSDMRVLLILIPSEAQYGGRAAADEAAARWQTVEATVLPYTALVSPDIWERVSASTARR